MPVGFDLLVLGDAKPDLVLTREAVPAFDQGERLVDGALLTLGGSGGIAACGAARLGLRVAYVGVVGDDELGAFVTASLAARGVDTGGVVVMPERPTGVSVILKRGEQEAVLTAPGTIGDLRGDHVDRDLLRSSRMVHASSYFLQVGLRGSLPELFEEAHRVGASTSVDPNRDPAGEWESGFLDLLSQTDVLFANSTEVRAVTGLDDVDVAAAALAERGTVVAVKFHQGGGLAMWGDEVVRSETLPTDVVDTTGAGATFAAGFLAGRVEGWSIERCLGLAVACASLSTQAVGGTEGQPTMEEALAALGGTT